MRKRSGVPSGELSDTRRLGSADARWYASQGKKAVFRRRSIAARTVDAARGRSDQYSRAKRGHHGVGVRNIPRSEAKSPKASSTRGAKVA